MTVSTHTRWILAVAVAALWTLQGAVVAQDAKEKPETTVKPFEYVNAETERLLLFLGPWRVTERHFNTKGDVVATVKGTEEITWLVDRRAIQRAYQTISDTTTYKAVGTLTYNAVAKRYEGMWLDNMSLSGPVKVTADWDKAARSMTYTLETQGSDGKTRTFKRIEEFPEEEHAERRIATTFQVDGSKVVKLFEVQYQRAHPCPSGIQRVFDN